MAPAPLSAEFVDSDEDIKPSARDLDEKPSAPELEEEPQRKSKRARTASAQPDEKQPPKGVFYDDADGASVMNFGNMHRVSVRRVGDSVLVDIRKMYKDKEGNVGHTKKGITFPADVWAELMGHREAVDEALRNKGYDQRGVEGEER